MAINEDSDDGEDFKDYVCKESGITGRELDCFVAFDECNDRSADGVEALIEKYGAGDEAKTRKFIYAHLVHCKGCETEYNWFTLYRDLTQSMRKNIDSAHEHGISLKDIFTAIGMSPEAAEECAKLKKNSRN